MTGERATAARGSASHDVALRARVRDIVGVDKIKSYRTLDLSYTFRDAIFIYATLVATISLACFLHSTIGYATLLAVPVLAVIAGVAFNWINVQIHEASHQLLIRNAYWNDVYCNLALGCWALQDVETYRATHGMHHAHLHTERDPDLEMYTFGSVREVLRGRLEDLLIITAFRRQRHVTEFIAANSVAYAGPPLYTFAAKVAAQAIVLGTFLYFCGLWGAAYYGGIYLYGLLAVFPVLVGIRAVVQHRDDKLPDAVDGEPLRYVARTTVAPIMECILVGARIDYHFEHHLFPMIPYYNLRMMHECLERAGLFEDCVDSRGRELSTKNYLSTYVSLVR